MGRKGLNVRERRFVDAYLGDAGGNASKAVRAAGYSARTQKSAQVTGSRLLSKAIVRAAVNKRLAKETAASIATVEERDKRLTQIMRLKTAELNAVIRAIVS